MAHLSCIGWIQIGGAFALCTCSTPSKFASFWPLDHFCCLRVCLVLLYVLVGVYLLWREGCMGFWTYVPCLLSLFGLGVASAKALIFLPSLCCFFFFYLWASWLLILSYHLIVFAITLPSFLLYVTLCISGLMFLPCQPTPLSIFFA